MSVRVLYLAGSMRSGSTILGKILGNLDGFFDVGEIRQFWSRMCLGKKRCGCGTWLDACPFWAGILSGLRQDGIDIPRVADLQSRLIRTRKIGRGLTRKFHSRAAAEWEELAAATQRLYERVAAHCPGRTIVDSSKLPTHLMLLKELDGMELCVIHLVRDGRAVAYSWAKRRESRSGHRSACRSMLIWIVENALIKQMLRGHRHQTLLRYEDFADRPEPTLAGALSRLELETDLGSLARGELEILETHSVAGNNQVRFAGRSQQVVFDQSWRDRLELRTKNLLTLMGFFSLRRYGYVWRL